jgi:anti-sigma B factor antagonist
MAFKLSTRLVGDVTVIDLSGRLDIGQGVGTLRDTLQNALANGAKVLVNLGEVTFIDTAGLGELAAGHARAQREGTSLKLTAVPKRVDSLLQMTGLDKILDIQDSEADAIESWGGEHSSWPGEVGAIPSAAR